MNNLKEKYTDEYLKKLDKNHTFIPLTRDYMFKAIMTRCTFVNDVKQNILEK